MPDRQKSNPKSANITQNSYSSCIRFYRSIFIVLTIQKITMTLSCKGLT